MCCCTAYCYWLYCVLLLVVLRIAIGCTAYCYWLYCVLLLVCGTTMRQNNTSVTTISTTQGCVCTSRHSQQPEHSVHTHTY